MGLPPFAGCPRGWNAETPALDRRAPLPILAEGEGFEPSLGPFDPTSGLANRPLRPLEYPSTLPTQTGRLSHCPTRHAKLSTERPPPPGPDPPFPASPTRYSRAFRCQR